MRRSAERTAMSRWRTGTSASQRRTRCSATEFRSSGDGLTDGGADCHGVGEAADRIALETAANQGFPTRRDAGPAEARAGLSEDWGFAGKDLAENETESPDVGTEIGRGAIDLFGRQIIHGSDQTPGPDGIVIR